MTLDISDLFQSPSFQLIYNAQLQLKTTQNITFYKKAKISYYYSSNCNSVWLFGSNFILQYKIYKNIKCSIKNSFKHTKKTHSPRETPKSSQTSIHSFLWSAVESFSFQLLFWVIILFYQFS